MDKSNAKENAHLLISDNIKEADLTNISQDCLKPTDELLKYNESIKVMKIKCKNCGCKVKRNHNKQGKCLDRLFNCKQNMCHCTNPDPESRK